MNWDYDLRDHDHRGLESPSNQVRVVRKPEQPPSEAGGAHLEACPNCETGGNRPSRDKRIGPGLAEISPETMEHLLRRDRKRVSSEAILSSDDELYVVACQCGLSGQVTTSPGAAVDSWKRAVARRIRMIQAKEQRA